MHNIKQIEYTEYCLFYLYIIQIGGNVLFETITIYHFFASIIGFESHSILFSTAHNINNKRLNWSSSVLFSWLGCKRAIFALYERRLNLDFFFAILLYLSIFIFLSSRYFSTLCLVKFDFLSISLSLPRLCCYRFIESFFRYVCLSSYLLKVNTCQRHTLRLHASNLLL